MFFVSADSTVVSGFGKGGAGRKPPKLVQISVNSIIRGQWFSQNAPETICRPVSIRTRWGAQSAPQTSYLDWGRPTDMHAGGEESKKGTEAKKRGYMGKKGWKQNGKG